VEIVQYLYVSFMYSASGLEIRECDVGIVVLATQHHLSVKVGTNFADKPRSLGRYICSRTKATKFFFYAQCLYEVKFIDNILEN
jgi:hypothetical protein